LKTGFMNGRSSSNCVRVNITETGIYVKKNVFLHSIRETLHHGLRTESYTKMPERSYTIGRSVRWHGGGAIRDNNAALVSRHTCFKYKESAFSPNPPRPPSPNDIRCVLCDGCRPKRPIGGPSRGVPWGLAESFAEVACGGRYLSSIRKSRAGGTADRFRCSERPHAGPCCWLVTRWLKPGGYSCPKWDEIKNFSASSAPKDGGRGDNPGESEIHLGIGAHHPGPLGPGGWPKFRRHGSGRERSARGAPSTGGPRPTPIIRSYTYVFPRRRHWHDGEGNLALKAGFMPCAEAGLGKAHRGGMVSYYCDNGILHRTATRLGGGSATR